MRVARDRRDLLERFREQVTLLREAAERFDREGPDAERRHAKSMSVALRVLLHDGPDGGNAVSILTRIEIKGGLLFHDTSTIPDEPEVVEHEGRKFVVQPSMHTGGMVGMQLGRNTVYRANLGPPHRKLPFDEWWTRIVLMLPAGPYSRKDIVKTMADQEAAHVDAGLAEEYHNLSRGNAMGIEIAVGGTKLEWNEDPTPAVVRQVAHEVLATLEEQAKDCEAPGPKL